MYKRILFFLCLLALIFSGCNDNPTDNSGIFPPTTIPFVAYNSPVWHPSGQFIGFNHTPIKSIHYSGNSSYPDSYQLEPDSLGFWLINSDGTNMRRILPYPLQTPAWSPDGQWVAFVFGTQIYKMRFTGTSFDTTTIVQLTTEGRNFFPAWSPDGKWIIHDRTFAYPETEVVQGIWLLNSFDGSNRKKISTGRFPDWSPNNKELIFMDWFDSTQKEAGIIRYNLNNSLKELIYNVQGNDIRRPKYSPDGSKIAFASQPLNSQVNLWFMDSTGSNLQQLTYNGMSDNSGVTFSWDSTGKFIVFTKYRFDKWPPQNGTLWIININTGQQCKLTFNPHH